MAWSWPPENTILSSVLKGNFSQATSRAVNYVKSGELTTDLTNAGRLLASGGTDAGAWANAGAKAIGGYKGAGDLTGGYGDYLNAAAAAFDFKSGGLQKTQNLMKSDLGKNLMSIGDKASKLAQSSDTLMSFTNAGPRYDAAIQNNAASSSSLQRNAVGLPPNTTIYPMSRYEPNANGQVLDPATFEGKTSIPAWAIIAVAGYFLFIKN